MPTKTISPLREVSRTQIWNGDEIKVEAGKRYYLDVEYDSDERNYALVEFTQTEEVNPDYEKQLAAYEKTQAKYTADLAAYEVQLKLWESEEGKRKLEQYNRLKQELGL